MPLDVGRVCHNEVEAAIRILFNWSKCRFSARMITVAGIVRERAAHLAVGARDNPQLALRMTAAAGAGIESSVPGAGRILALGSRSGPGSQIEVRADGSQGAQGEVGED